MRQLFRCSVLAMLYTFLAASRLHAASTADTVQYSGASENRVDMVFFADGWGTSEESAMKALLRDHIHSHFGVPTFARYRNFFNIYIANHYRSAPPEGVNEAYARDHYPYYADECTRAVPSAEVRYVVCNGSGWGQYYQANLGMTGTDDWDIIGTHELSHGWNILADTYGGMDGEWVPNRTTNPKGIWEHWLGFQEPYNGDVVGVYPVEDANSYRSIEHPNTLMGHARSKTRVIAYTPEEREWVIMNIYEYVDPIDSWAPQQETPENPETLKVDVVDTQVIKVDWYMDGERVAEEGGEVFPVFDHVSQPGSYSVRAHVYDYGVKAAFSDRGGNPDGEPGSHPSDSLDWIRKDFENVQQEVQWDLRITKIPVPASKRGASPAHARIGAVEPEEIELYLPGGGYFTLEIFTSKGHLLARIASGGSAASRLVLPWDGSAYHPGVYLMRLSHKGNVSWKKWLPPLGGH